MNRFHKTLLGATLLGLGLAISATAAPAAPPIWAAGLDNGLQVGAADDSWFFQSQLVVQTRFAAAQKPGSQALQDGFLVRMVRPQLRGHLVQKWIKWFVQPELAGTTPRLLDLEVTAQPWPGLGVKVGQFVTPFSRAFLTPVPRLQFPDFSIANDKFRADRDTGLQLQGDLGRGLLGWQLGVFNGNGIDKGGNDDNRLAAVGRIAVQPLGPMELDEVPELAADLPLRLSVGLSGWRGELPHLLAPVGAAAPVQQGFDQATTLCADAMLAQGAWHLQIQGYGRTTDPASGKAVSSGGADAQAGLLLLQRKLEVGARVAAVVPDLAAQDRSLVVEGQLVGYAWGHHAKAWLRGAWQQDHSAAGDKNGWSITLQQQVHL